MQQIEAAVMGQIINAVGNNRGRTPEFPGFDSSRSLMFKGWSSHVHREFPGQFESANLSGDNLSGEIGGMWGPRRAPPRPLREFAEARCMFTCADLRCHQAIQIE